VIGEERISGLSFLCYTIIYAFDDQYLDFHYFSSFIYRFWHSLQGECQFH
jgi:hypothetical protein